MKKILILFVLITIASITCNAQTTITGKIITKKGEPVMFANIAIKGSFDGTSSNLDGEFSFITSKNGEQIIMVSCIGYQAIKKAILLNEPIVQLDIILKPSVSEIDAVYITAGAFEASEEKRAVNMKSTDIGTTAGALGNIIGAIETLPGTQTVGESNGLFVRGGSGSESKIIIDEMVVLNPYYSPVPDIKQRGRFDPFMFSGMIFSSGGYSALYGQALSSTLVLKSKGLADSTNTGGGIHLYGTNVFHTHRWENTSLYTGISYNNFQPYHYLFNIDKYNKSTENTCGKIIFRQKISDNGLFKFYSNISKTELGVDFEEISNPDEKYSFSLENKNLYINSSYREFFKDEKWSLFVGFSYSKDKDNAYLDTVNMSEDEEMMQSKIMVTNNSLSNVTMKVGGEIQSFDVSGKMDNSEGVIKNLFCAGFFEVDWIISQKLATRTGVRYEYSDYLLKWNIAPRLSIAYKVASNSQVSFAFGKFYQTPEKDFLYYSDNKYDYENADHYILNYQWMNNKRIFRIELYDKEYNDLIKDIPDVQNTYNNSGTGYARGIDIFWRDEKTIPLADYWISYSYLDTKRDYRDFPKEAVPDFAAKHNLSFVYKHWVGLINSMVGFNYSYSSGRPYYDPNRPENKFHTDYTKEYHNLDINISKITKLFNRRTVIYSSLRNVLGNEHIFGYHYLPDGNSRIPISPVSKRSFFIGLFISTY